MLTNTQLKVSAGYSATLVACTLIFVKFAAWKYTGSIAVQASMVDSTMDAITSVINLFAIKHAYKPANQYYHWGYGKAEALASFAQSILFASSSIRLLWEIAERFLNPEPLDFSYGAVGIIVFAILVTGLLVGFQKYVICKTHSLIIKADCLHYETDLLANFAVIVSLFLTMRFNFVYLDTIIALCITLYVLSSAWKIFWASANILMDKEIDTSLRERISEIVRSYPEVQEVYNIKSRSDSQKTFVQISVGLDEDIVLSDAIHITKEMEKQIHAEFPSIDVTIHHH